MKNSGLGRKIAFIVLGLILIGGAIYSSFSNAGTGVYTQLSIYVLDILGAVCIIYGVVSKPNTETKKLSIREISIVGVMGALSIVLYMFVKTPIPALFPSFLDFQISELPALITSFAYGPFAGALVIIVRFIIKLPFTGTAGVGEVADLVLGLIVVCISGIIYQRKKTLKRAVIGMGASMLIATFAACLLNWLVLIPFYLQLYFNGNMEILVGMCSMIPGINSENFMPLYIFVGVLPFNLLRYILVYVLTLLLYKKIHFLFNKISKSKKEEVKLNKSTK